MDYKRLTNKKELQKASCCKCRHNFANSIICERHCADGDCFELIPEIAKLIELEDKIESGTLVESGYHIQKSYRNHDDQRYKIVLIDEIEMGEFGYGLTKAEAEAKLRELEGDRE